MRRATLYGALALCLSIPTLHIPAQTSTQDEESVRNAYAKLSFLCALDPLTQSALDQLGGLPTDDLKINAKIAKSTPTYTLSAFESGTVATIATDQWRQFIALPQPGANQLAADLMSYNNSDSGNATAWYAARAQWRPTPKITPDAEKAMLDRTVGEAIKLYSPEWSESPATYTRYVAFTVDAALDGKSTGPHQAIFFFGTDAHGHEVVAVNDPLSGAQALWQMFDQSTYPTGLLSSRLRDTPVVATWIRANEIPAASCDTAKRDVCCSHGRCGISTRDLNRDLATVLPAPKNGEPQ
jgi:hypothetical protein